MNFNPFLVAKLKLINPTLTFKSVKCVVTGEISQQLRFGLRGGSGKGSRRDGTLRRSGRLESSVQDNSVEEEEGQHNPNTESKGPPGGEEPEQSNAGELPAQEDEEEEEEKHP